MNHRTTTLIAAAALLLPACFGLFASGVPTIIGPFPVLTALPALFLASFGMLWRIAVLIPSALFLLWNPHLFRGSVQIPTRTLVLFGVLIPLNIVYFKESWNFGLQYQGARFLYLMCIVNAVAATVIGVLLFVGRRNVISFWKALAIQWFLFAWLAWCAFPYWR